MMKKHLHLFAIAMLAFASSFAQDAATTTPSDTSKTWTIKGENTFLLNQTSFTNWSAGGINSFAGNLLFNYDFNYKKNKWSWANKVIAGYGLSKQGGTGWRKNDDKIVLNSLLGYQAAPRWYYSFYANFLTQFNAGYDYSQPEKTLISNAFAPAYLSFGPGFEYRKTDNFHFNLSPAATRLIMVNDNYLSAIGAFGVDTGKHLKTQFGASFDLYYKVPLVENISVENILNLYSDYLDNPQNVYVNYSLNLFMKVNKFVTVNAGAQMIYDDNTKMPFFKDGVTRYSPVLQIKEIFGAGLTYKF